MTRFSLAHSIISLCLFLNILPTCRCCQATAAQLATCSVPIYQNSSINNENFCPTPPTVTVGSQETGALDSISVYVAEHLLEVSEEVELALFFQQFAAGFVVHSPDSPYATCGDENEDISCARLVPALTSFQTSLQYLNSTNPINACLSTLNSTVNQNCSQLSPANWSTHYDGYLEACIAIATCGTPSSGNSLVGKQSSNPHKPNIVSVTVWYNNQVRKCGPFTHKYKSELQSCFTLNDKVCNE